MTISFSKYLGLTLLLCWSLSCSAQLANGNSPDKMNKVMDEWVEGDIYFEDGSQYHGVFSYNSLVPDGALKVKEGDKMWVATPKDVLRFTYQDEQKVLREYYSMHYENSKMFMELFYEGETFALLGRKVPRVFKYEGYNGYQQNHITPDYLRIILDLRTSEYYRFEKSPGYKLFGEDAKSVKQYVRESGLSMKTIEGIQAAIIYYDSIQKSK